MLRLAASAPFEQKSATGGRQPENLALGHAIESYGDRTGNSKTLEASTGVIVGKQNALLTGPSKRVMAC